MSPQPRDVLVDIVAQYGLPVLKSPLRCEGLLKDYCGEHRREIAALMKCLRAGLIDQFGQQNGTPIKTVCSRLATTFEQTPDISKAMAQWTIESWAVALGLLDPTAATALFPELVAPQQATPESPLSETETPAAEEKPEDTAPSPQSEFLAKVFTPGWPVPDWSRPQRQIIVHPDSSGRRPTLRDALREADETTCILLKPGLYKEALAIKRNLQIRGDGEAADIIIESAGASVVLLDGACLFMSGITLKGLPGKDKKAAAAVEIKSGHLAMEYCNLTSDSSTIMEVKGPQSEVLLRHCHLHDGKAGGISFQDSAEGYLEECDFYQNKLSHVVIGKGCAPTLLSCKISNAMMAGLYVNDGGAGLIENCDIWGNAVAGIQCQRKGNPRVRLCRISLNQRYGVLVTEKGEGSFEKCQIFDNARSGMTVQQSVPKLFGCQIFDNHGEGLEISDQSQGEAIDCEIFNNEGANIGMKDKSTMLFRDCQIHDGQQEGIRLTGGADARFEKCSIYSNAKTGLWVTQSKLVLEGCQFYNGMETGIQMGIGSDGQFTNCSVTGHSGTAVVIGEKSQSRLERCDISRNLGVGIQVDDGASPVLQNCTVNENRGVGFTCTKAGIPRMVEGEINGNTGGGLLVSAQGKGRWEKVSFIGNSGVGIEIEDGGSSTLKQVQVLNGKGIGILVRDLGAGTAEKCEVHDNAEGDWKVPETARLKRIDA
jgi:parallel beta-helix repeat protein